jgi:hypothetical protein
MESRMVERDQYGYLLKIVSNFPYHPWWRLTSQLVEGFRDKKRNGIVSSVGIYTPKFGLGSLENPKMTDQREAIAAPFKDRPKHLQSLEIPLTPQHLCTKCVIPLHKGAEKYYREIGCL